MNKLITGKQLSEHLNISYFTVMDWAEKGLIPSIKVERVRRFDFEEVMQWIKDGNIEKKRSGISFQ